MGLGEIVVIIGFRFAHFIVLKDRTLFAKSRVMFFVGKWFCKSSKEIDDDYYDNENEREDKVEYTVKASLFKLYKIRGRGWPKFQCFC